LNKPHSTYVPLWCKSNASFLEGASHPEELVEAAHQLGLPAIAITDRDGVYGLVAAHQAAKRLGLSLIIGAEITLENGSTLVLLVQTQTGYRNLCRLITLGRCRSPKGRSRVSMNEVCEHAIDLLALWGGSLVHSTSTATDMAALRQLHIAFADRLYLLLTRHVESADRYRELKLLAYHNALKLPLVAAMELLYHHPERRSLQDLLTCIRHGITLDQAGTRLKPNAEHVLLSSTAFQQRFADYPQAIANSLLIAERCRFSLADLRYRYPSEKLPNGMTSAAWLHRLTFEGAHFRYDDGIPAAVQQQLQKELRLIHELEYDGYFLTMWEVVDFCRRNNILCQGRGSAANSAVCYCLGITAIDPVRMNLLFERFISKERAEPPDIDLDIMHERREEVIRFMYQRYGRSHAAMVANVIRYRPRSAIRDVGKAFGIPESMLLRISKLIRHHDRLTPELLATAGTDLSASILEQLLTHVDELCDFPRHLSIHPGGFLLGHEPVHDLVPIENATRDGRTVIQWDKTDIEALGLFKVDLLGLGALSQLDRAFKLLNRHHQIELSMATIPAEDRTTFEMTARGDTVGVFQIESRAQMNMLPRLQPRCFYDLVIEVSIVRPGPISGGMVHPYLRRRNGQELVLYPHPSLEPVLAKTLGVPLFQEQVIKLAVIAADYTPGEADQLRRDMAAWRRSGQIDGHRQRLIDRMIRKGIAVDFAERVFEQIRGFGEYGFPESHAASFALIAYATAYLKCHYPAVFACSLLNAQPMGFYAPATIIEDAKRHGVAILPVDVQHSDWDCTLEPLSSTGLTPHPHPLPLGERVGVRGQADDASFKTLSYPPTTKRYALRIGLRYIQGLPRTVAERIIAHRPFHSIDDFRQRTELDADPFKRLATAGALSSLCDNRRQALWDGLRTLPASDLGLPNQESRADFSYLTFLETIQWDYASKPLSEWGHPLQPLRAELNRLKLPTARDVATCRSGQKISYAGIVICRQQPGTASGITFMTLEDETGFVNLVFYPAVFEKFQILLKTASFLGVTGRLQVEQSVVHLLAETVWQPQLSITPEAIQSRDFH